jgi:hypothetical protein
MLRHVLAAAMLFALLLAAAPLAARTRLAGPYDYRFGEAAVAEGEPGAGWSRVAALTDIPQRGDPSLWLRMQLPAGDGESVALLPRLYQEDLREAPRHQPRRSRPHRPDEGPGVNQMACERIMQTMCAFAPPRRLVSHRGAR